jgi:hypothetical protein
MIFLPRAAKTMTSENPKQRPARLERRRARGKKHESTRADWRSGCSLLWASMRPAGDTTRLGTETRKFCARAMQRSPLGAFIITDKTAGAMFMNLIANGTDR